MTVDLSQAKPLTWWETRDGRCVLLVGRVVRKMDVSVAILRFGTAGNVICYPTYDGRDYDSSRDIIGPWRADRQLPEYVPARYRELIPVIQKEKEQEHK